MPSLKPLETLPFETTKSITITEGSGWFYCKETNSDKVVKKGDEITVKPGDKLCASIDGCLYEFC
jgi:hypothetical protein